MHPLSAFDFLLLDDAILRPAFLHPILRSGKDKGHDKELKPSARFPFRSDKGYEGEVQVNGWVRDTELFNQQSCYVMQDDCLLPELTVREALTMSLQLRIPSLNRSKREQLVGAHSRHSTLNSQLLF